MRAMITRISLTRRLSSSPSYSLAIVPIICGLSSAIQTALGVDVSSLVAQNNDTSQTSQPSNSAKFRLESYASVTVRIKVSRKFPFPYNSLQTVRCSKNFDPSVLSLLSILKLPKPTSNKVRNSAAVSMSYSVSSPHSGLYRPTSTDSLSRIPV